MTRRRRDGRGSDSLPHARARTIGLKYMAPEQAPVALDDIEEQRPRTRGECVDGVRPCPWVGCRYHLYLDVTFAGGLTLRFPDLEPDELEHSCALDVADRGSNRLVTVGQVMNVTRERARQLEVKALFAYQAAAQRRRMRLDELVDGFAHALGNRTEDAA